MRLTHRPRLGLGPGERLFELGVLALSSAQQVSHANWLVGVGGQKRGVQGDVADVATGNAEASQAGVIQRVRWSRRRIRSTPRPER